VCVSVCVLFFIVHAAFVRIKLKMMMMIMMMMIATVLAPTTLLYCNMTKVYK